MPALPGTTAVAASDQTAVSDQTVVLTADQSRYELSLELSYLEDESGSLSLEEVKALWPERAVAGPHVKALNFGFTRSTYWFRIRIENRSSAEREWVLESLYPIMDNLEAYFQYDDGRRMHIHSGDSVPFEQRSKEHPNINYAFDLEAGQGVDLYLRAYTSGAIQMQLLLWSEDAFSLKDHRSQMLFGLYYGLIIAMAVYNLLIFMAIRDINYLWYVAYIVTYGLLQSSLNGLSFQALWPDQPWWNNRSIAFFLSTGFFFILGFTRSFLLLKANLPRIDLYFRAMMAFYLILSVLALLAPYNITIRLGTLGATISAVSVFAVGLYCWIKRFKPARYFMIAWSVLLFGMLCYTLKTFGALPANFFTEFAIQIGSAAEVVLLSFALADRIRVLTLKNQEMQRELTEELERRVSERTRALEDANLRLADLSATDGLTGVRNRRHFDEALAFEFARTRREQTPLSVLLIDVDHFKQFNDTYGHQVGDQCLINVAQLIRESVHRDTDIVARYGGEEFAAILPSTSAEGALNVAEQIRNKIKNQSLALVGRNLQVSVSIGITTAPPGIELGTELMIQRADKALYLSKENGRDRCTFLALALAS